MNDVVFDEKKIIPRKSHSHVRIVFIPGLSSSSVFAFTQVKCVVNEVFTHHGWPRYLHIDFLQLRMFLFLFLWSLLINLVYLFVWLFFFEMGMRPRPLHQAMHAAVLLHSLKETSFTHHGSHKVET